jgi:hypothetical protein
MDVPNGGLGVAPLPPRTPTLPVASSDRRSCVDARACGNERASGRQLVTYSKFVPILLTKGVVARV